MSSVHVDLSERYTCVRSGISACDERRYLCHGSHGGTDGFAYAEAGRTVSADKMPDRKAVHLVGKNGSKAISDKELYEFPNGGAVDLAQSQTFSGYSGPVAPAIQKPVPF